MRRAASGEVSLVRVLVDTNITLLRGQQLRVVLHLEQPVKTSKLFPRAIDPSKVQLKLRTIIKSIDPHPKVVESTQMQGLEWTVTGNMNK